MKAILTAASFVGIIAVGLTVIVLSGSLFSLALGQTAAVSAMFFLYSVRWGLGAAIILTLLLGLAIGAVQGFAVGAWGANPIIITIGAAGLLEGMAVWLSHGKSIVPPDNRTSWEHLANPVLGLPAPVYVFIAVSILLAVVMRRTRFGRQIYLLGENRVAARAAALPITLLTVGAFGIASLYTAGSGILIGATSANASLLLVGQLHVRRDRGRAGRRERRHGRQGLDRADGPRRDLHRDDLGHAPAARLLDRRADPRSRDHRRRGRRPHEPAGAQPVSARETTRRAPVERSRSRAVTRSSRSWSSRSRSCRSSRSTRCAPRTSTTSSRTSPRTASSPSRSGSRSSPANSTSRSRRCTSSGAWSPSSPGTARRSSGSS